MQSPSILMEEFFCAHDFFTQGLVWKGKQEAFRDFPEFLRKVGPNKIAVYLETQVEVCKDRNILIGIHGL